jgi:hypothetical protein
MKSAQLKVKVAVQSGLVLSSSEDSVILRLFIRLAEDTENPRCAGLPLVQLCENNEVILQQ